jgi:Protein of unknown function (DUF2380)
MHDRTRRVAVLLAAVLFLLAGATARAEGVPRIAVFGFQLIDTSPAPPTPEERDRTRRLGEALNEALQRSGRYEVVDTSPVRAKLAGMAEIRDCNGCERPLARELGASQAAYGWVQKVSNLILNLNLVIEDVASGRILHAGSVDIRGNTDESWFRGLKFLLEEHVFDTAPG